MDSNDDDAPVYEFPDTKIVALEHPCIIRNLNRGIKSLGGNQRLQEFLQAPATKPKILYASVRPEDPYASKVAAQKAKTNSFLLKVTAPKRTGRKRKRGSDDPFQADPAWDAVNPWPIDSRDMLRILRDNSDRVTISPVAKLREVHRFRGLQDFQYASSTNSLAQNMRDSLLSGDFEKIKTFTLDPTKGLAPGQDISLPPRMRLAKDPLHYNYKQNLSVRVWTDAEGITHTANVHKSQLLINHIVPHDSDTIPAESPVKLQPEGSLDLRVRKCIELLRKALNKRPVMSRRVQMSVTGAPTEQILRATWAYLGYMFKSGPFKDTLIKFGVDPRSDPKYREYQSIAIQVPETGRNNKRRYGKGPTPSKTPRTYMFDGKGVYVDGKVWQVCDISDPLLKRLIREASPVTEYEPVISGWFGNGSWALIRIIMKDKVHRIINNAWVPDAFYGTMLDRWQDHIDELNVDKTYADPNTHPDLIHLMNAARSRATNALREARIERNRRRRLKGITEADEVVLGGDNDVSSLSDPGSDIDLDDDGGGDSDGGDSDEEGSDAASSEGD